jgi:hypothetical protein
MQTMLQFKKIYMKIGIIFSDLCWLFLQKFTLTFVRCISYFCPILVKRRMIWYEIWYDVMWYDVWYDMIYDRSFLVQFPSSIFRRSAFRNSLGVMYLQLPVHFQLHANFNIKFYRCAYLRFDILFHVISRNHLLCIDTRHKANYIDSTSVIPEKQCPLVIWHLYQARC